MRQIAVISGKGGSGKTTIVASIASVTERVVLVDCDVDAPNLGILIKHEIREKHEFYGMQKASILQDKCISCGLCEEECRFDAIHKDDGMYSIDRTACEGCRVCAKVCPSEAIEMIDNLSGYWFLSYSAYGPFIHAKLKAGEENSGKLVSLIRNEAREVAEKTDTVLIDAPAGIGCPVIAALSGVDEAIVVFEPTLSGLHDGIRAIEIAEHFGAKIYCMINRSDLNEKISNEIKGLCRQKGIDILEEIPYDIRFVKALSEKRIAAEVYEDIRHTFEGIWARIDESG
ncbi:MAG: ATP-binding protein [Candidatus Thermoplasmatota archaeon]|nr:ATP-binding protein [Candidatus Thermoplasmatota archaeon]